MNFQLCSSLLASLRTFCGLFWEKEEKLVVQTSVSTFREGVDGLLCVSFHLLHGKLRGIELNSPG